MVKLKKATQRPAKAPAASKKTAGASKKAAGAGVTLRTVTGAQMAFLANIKRPQAFLHIFDNPGGTPRRQGRPTDNEKELLRATVVFALAALDAYLHDVVLEEVPVRGVKSDTLLEPLRAIARDDPALPLRVALADNKSARHAEFRAALGSWLSAKAFQGPEAVKRALGYVGCSPSAAELDRSIGSGWAGDLTSWTTMRNGMVHRAETPYIRRADAAKCVDLVIRIVATVEGWVNGPGLPFKP